MTVKRLLPLILLTGAVFAGLTGYGDFGEVADNLLSFPLPHLLLALALAAANYLLRYLRWEYYFRTLGTRVPLGLSALVFLSGLAMALTPGKVGELSKAFLLRDRAQVPLSVSAPVVVMERVTDLLAVAALSLGALLLLPFGSALASAGLVMLVGAVLAVAWRPRGGRLLRLPLLRRWRPLLESSLDSLGVLGSPRPLLIALALSTLAWVSEGISLWVIVQGLDLSLSPVEAVGVYAAATLIGAASLLPGGLGGTEGSMALFLRQLGLPRGGASSATLLVRLCTLWFAFLIGLLSLLWLQRTSLREQPVEV
ncbi:MAG: lysylphosphatidylglycerol synthase transmembrane domain-containing protein [Chloroflexi bacterium]|nr:lysylphosphatidylglycerol synthase transmembrane domain-containing protein [Chloroflexota bacterium]